MGFSMVTVFEVLHYLGSCIAKAANMLTTKEDPRAFLLKLAQQVRPYEKLLVNWIAEPEPEHFRKLLSLESQMIVID